MVKRHSTAEKYQREKEKQLAKQAKADRRADKKLKKNGGSNDSQS